MGKKRREERERNRTKTGGDVVDIKDTVDMIKNPYKYNKNIKKNILTKMKKEKKQRVRNFMGDAFGNASSMGFISTSRGPGDRKHDNKRLRKKISKKGNRTRFKNRRRR